MDLDSFLTELYVMIDEWWQAQTDAHLPQLGRPPQLSTSEVLTLALLAQWPRWRSERDFWRFANAHLRSAFPALCSQSQFNRRVRALEPVLRRLHRALAAQLTDRNAVYHVLDTSLIPAIHRVRACRHGLFASEASFGRCASKTEWVYGFKVALVVDPAGIITAFGLAPANSDDRPIGDALIAADRYPAYPADKGFAAQSWERSWRETYGCLVAATPNTTAKRAWTEDACHWAAGKRQVIEHVIGQLKDFFALERHRAKTLGGVLTRLAAKVAAYTVSQVLNHHHARPLRHFADLLI